MKRVEIAGLLIVLSLYGILGFYDLDTIPAEWFGDISIVHEYVQAVLSGSWPWYYFLSAGPLYHYIIAPFIAIAGSSYLSYKTASVLIGATGIVATYGFVRQTLHSSVWGLIGAAFLSTSAWYLAWSRLGNSQVLIVPLSAGMLWSVARWNHTRDLFHFFLGVLFSGMGMFLYPQTWMLPIGFLVLVLVKRPQLKWKQSVLPVLLLVVIFCMAWISVVMRSREEFTGGYIGTKIWPAFVASPSQTLDRFGQHAIHTIGMLHVRGDNLFRVNVEGSPHLDILSGILFLVGAFVWMRKGARDNFYIWIPILLFILPSMSPALPLGETPSSGRTIAILPLVVLLIVVGLKQVYKVAGIGLVIALMTGSTLLNIYKYFVLYPHGLPDENVPVARLISSYIDTLPESTIVYMDSCCWGEWGQPEPKAIYYQLKKQESRDNILAVVETSCSDIPKIGEIVIIGNPNDTEWTGKWLDCRAEYNILNTKDTLGRNAFTALHLP